MQDSKVALPPYEWTELDTDHRVGVCTGHGRTLIGSVDVIADDASIFWLWLDDGGGRIAIHESDDVKVWRVPVK